MISCPNCNKLIKDDVKFCPWCGSKIILKIEDNTDTDKLTENVRVSYSFVLIIILILSIIMFIVIFFKESKTKKEYFLNYNYKKSNEHVLNKKDRRNYNKWGIDIPSYIICSSACYTEKEARKRTNQLIKNGYKAGYLWIPDYPSLSGAKMYVVYIGPYKSRRTCVRELRKYQKFNQKAYAVLVSNNKKRIEIR